MMVESTFDTGEVILNYAEGPDNGPPLLLLHGANGLWQVWEPIITALTPKWHVYAPDFRGHGKSGRVPRGYHFRDFTRDIVAFIRAQHTRPTTIIGHSLGSLVAAQLAGEHPELVRATILEDPPLYLLEHLEEWALYPLVRAIQLLVSSDEPLDEAHVVSQLIEQLGMQPAEAQGWAPALVRTDPDVNYQGWGDFSFWEGIDGDALLDRIACPVLLLHGEWTYESPVMDGSVLTTADVDRATTRLQHATIHGFTGVGHLLHGPATAEEFLRVVTTFLDALP
jgi:pimeloyl-ACP methyl ester carboxylesterase